jgi:hypothetical protein
VSHAPKRPRHLSGCRPTVSETQLGSNLEYFMYMKYWYIALPAFGQEYLLTSDKRFLFNRARGRLLRVDMAGILENSCSSMEQ